MKSDMFKNIEMSNEMKWHVQVYRNIERNAIWQEGEHGVNVAMCTKSDFDNVNMLFFNS